MKTVRARGLGIAFAVCGLAGAAGFAQAQSDSASPCASITDDKSRLQCYDAEHALKRSQSARPSTAAPSPRAAPSQPAVSPPAASQPASSQPAASPAAAPAAASSATSSPEPVPAPGAAETAPPKPAATSGSADAGFGSETLRRKSKSADPEEPAEITAKVASVAGKRKGDYRITLDNGQVWAETQRTGGEPPAPGDTVTLRRGKLGSYFLSKGSGLALRVTRVK